MMAGVTIAEEDTVRQKQAEEGGAAARADMRVGPWEAVG